jgi:hypothetical protein
MSNDVIRAAKGSGELAIGLDPSTIHDPIIPQELDSQE